MQRDLAAFAGNPSFAYGYEADGCMANGPLDGQCNYRAPVSPALGVPSGMTSPHIRSQLELGVFEFQPSKVVCRSLHQDDGNLEQHASSFKEDTEEIDALLSSDEDSDEDDVMSTGRSPDPLEIGPCESSSPPRFKKMKHFPGNCSVFNGSMENITHEKIRNMVAVLRGIIPGGDQLDAPDVLEEAVRYLKFLKVEAEKLGVAGFNA